MAKNRGNSKTTSEEERHPWEIGADRLMNRLRASGHTVLDMEPPTDTTQYSVNFVPHEQPKPKSKPE
jgi:hypothetical protein